MVFAIVLTVPFLSLVSGAMTEKTLYADTPVEWAVSYDPENGRFRFGSGKRQ